MITQSILHNLTKNIETINNEVKEKGFSNIRLFKPLMKGQQEKLHFLVKIEDRENVSLFTKAELQLKLASLVDYEDLILLTENELNEEGKSNIIGESISLDPTKIKDINTFFEANILKNIKPTTNMPYTLKFENNELVIRVPAADSRLEKIQQAEYYVEKLHQLEKAFTNNPENILPTIEENTLTLKFGC